MEPASKIYGVHSDEECQSSESGWTMYLGSRVDDEKDHQNHSDYDGKTHGYDHKDDSDDSMVSDASSGPSTHQKARAAARVANKQEEKAKTKKHSAASATAKVRREYNNKPAEKKAKVKSSKAN